MPVEESIGGGSFGGVLDSGIAYLDNFEMAKAGLLGWPPVTDIDGNGFIEIDDLALICDNWLNPGIGDINKDGFINFIDLADFNPAW